MSRSLLPALLCCSLATFASDLKYTCKTTDAAGEHAAMTVYFQGERIRIDHRNEFGYGWKDGKPENVAFGPHLATIYQCDMHRVLELDFDHHQYTVTDLDRSGKPVNAKPVNFQPHPSGAKVKVLVEARDTGETKQLFGHTARHFIITRKLVPSPGACTAAAQESIDGWYIDIEPRADSCMAMNQAPAPSDAVAVLTSGNCIDDFEMEHSGPTPPPFPVEWTVTSDAPGGKDLLHATTKQVTELSPLPLDPQIFDLPTGYKHVDKLDNSPNLPWLLRGKLMWQNVKSTVWSWTPWGH